MVHGLVQKECLRGIFILEYVLKFLFTETNFHLYCANGSRVLFFRGCASLSPFKTKKKKTPQSYVFIRTFQTFGALRLYLKKWCGIYRRCEIKYFPAAIYLLKVNIRNTRTRCEICSNLKIKAPELRQWRRSGVFIVNFEHISHLVLVFLSLTLKI